MKRSDLKKFRERSQRRMLAFDFAGFMNKHGVSVEMMQKLLEYTYGGIEKMMIRGTIKPGALETLQKKYPDAGKFVGKGVA